MSISPQTARRWVLVSMVLLLVMGAYKGTKPGDVGMAKRLWGIGMLGTMLSVAADFVPALAGPFALLVVMGYATTGGDKALTNVLGKVSGTPSGGGQDVPVRVVNTPPGSQVPQPTSPGTNP